MVRWGVEGHAAFADTPEAAQALARRADLPVTDEAGAIRALPIAGLRLDPETITALRRAGLRTIGDLADRHTAPLAARIGTAATEDRKSVGKGKRVSVRVDLGGRRIIQKKETTKTSQINKSYKKRQ